MTVVIPLNAKEFYNLFRENFKTNEAVRKAYENDKDLSQHKWTKLIADVLEQMLRQTGFEKETELKIAGGKIDEKWQKDGKVIFIEHENVDSVKNIVLKEVKNLLNADGDLRVLVTYFGTDGKRVELKARIKEKLNDEKRGKNFEFLLIMGTDRWMNDPDAWEAYVFEPSFEVRKLNSEA